VADIVDKAQAAEETQRAAALSRARKKSLVARSSERPGAPRDCIDCEEPIPKERLTALPQARRCVQCERIYEGRRRK
jgi:phage/conjugal plasmid C-4 type zinc finger TraR family protein